MTSQWVVSSQGRQYEGFPCGGRPPGRLACRLWRPSFQWLAEVSIDVVCTPLLHRYAHLIATIEFSGRSDCCGKHVTCPCPCPVLVAFTTTLSILHCDCIVQVEMWLQSKGNVRRKKKSFCFLFVSSVCFFGEQQIVCRGIYDCIA